MDWPVGISIDMVTDREHSDLRIMAVTDTHKNTIVLHRQSLAVITSPRLPMKSISEDQFKALLHGEITDWQDAGCPISIPVQKVSVAAVPPNRDPSDIQNVQDYEELVAQIPNLPGALAVVEVGDVDFRVNSLLIDDVDPLMLQNGSADSPLRWDLVIEGSGPIWDQIAPQLAARRPDPEEDAPEPISLTMVGDIILGRTVHRIMSENNDFNAPFRLVADEMKQADLTIANLECSLSDNIVPPDDPQTFAFMTYAAGVEGLVLSGIDGVSQANNHSMNFGALGMSDTLHTLDEAGIRHFGIGETLADARAPEIFEIKDRRIAFLGYDGITGHINGATVNSPGTAPMVTDSILEDIEAAVRQADIVIPFMHWGAEYELAPVKWQRDLARRCIDAGATMVVGSHPHWVQGMETYQGRPIIYSLGNFVFDQEWSLETRQGLIAHFVFRGDKTAALRFVPVLIEDYHRPRVVEGDQKITILDRVWQSSDILESTS